MQHKVAYKTSEASGVFFVLEEAVAARQIFQHPLHGCENPATIEKRLERMPKEEEEQWQTNK